MVNNRNGRTTRERILSRLIIAPSGCLLWMGYRDKDGYGRAFVRTGPKAVHQLAYEMFIGPVPPGAELDHLCRVTHCASPAHLEAVPHAVNTKRGWDARKQVAL